MNLPRLSRLRCIFGFHRWRTERYTSLNGHLVEGDICLDCNKTARDRTIIVRDRSAYRPPWAIEEVAERYVSRPGKFWDDGR
jgi:hypothetical protein